MTENPNDKPNQSAPPASTESEKPSTETQKTENMIPQSRFNQVNTERNQYKAQLETLQAEQTAAQEKVLAEQNRWQELFEAEKAKNEGLQSVQEEANQYQEAMKATNQSRIERIPEDKRSLIPDYDNPIKMSAWLDANASLLTVTGKPSPPNLDGGSGAGTNNTDAPLSAAHLRMANRARRAGFDVKDENVAAYAKAQRKPRQTGE
jgi:seryl-tRNA synthetase